MGYYIETGEHKGKAAALVERFGAEPAPQPLPAFVQVPADKVLVCVFHTAMYDAAAVIYDEHEYDDATWEGNPRPRSWLLMDRERAFRLCGLYSGSA